MSDSTSSSSTITKQLRSKNKKISETSKDDNETTSSSSSKTNLNKNNKSRSAAAPSSSSSPKDTEEEPHENDDENIDHEKDSEKVNNGNTNENGENSDGNTNKDGENLNENANESGDESHENGKDHDMKDHDSESPQSKNKNKKKDDLQHENKSSFSSSSSSVLPSMSTRIFNKTGELELKYPDVSWDELEERAIKIIEREDKLKSKKVNEKALQIKENLKQKSNQHKSNNKNTNEKDKGSRPRRRSFSPSSSRSPSRNSSRSRSHSYSPSSSRSRSRSHSKTLAVKTKTDMREEKEERKNLKDFLSAMGNKKVYFSGEPNKTNDIDYVENYFETWENQTNRYLLSDNQKCSIIRDFIESGSPALIFVNRKEIKDILLSGNWDTFKSKLFKQFIPNDKDGKLQEQLSNFKQTEKENVTNFYDRLTLINNSLERINEGLSERKLLQYYLDGLVMYIKTDVKIKNPRSVEEAWEVAKEIEKARKEKHQHFNKNKNEPKSNNQQQHKNNYRENHHNHGHNNNQNENNNSTNTTNYKNRSNDKYCVNCKNKGHLSGDCPDEWNPLTKETMLKKYNVKNQAEFAKQREAKRAEYENKNKSNINHAKEGHPKTKFSAIRNDDTQMKTNEIKIDFDSNQKQKQKSKQINEIDLQEALYANVKVQNTHDCNSDVFVDCLDVQVDNGSTLTLINRDLFHKLQLEEKDISKCLTTQVSSPLDNVNIRGTIIGKIPIFISFMKKRYEIDVYIVNEFDMPLIIGLDFLSLYACDIQHRMAKPMLVMNKESPIQDQEVILLHTSTKVEMKMKMNMKMKMETIITKDQEIDQNPQSMKQKQTTNMEQTMMNKIYSNSIDVSLNENKCNDSFLANVISKTSLCIPSRTTMFVNVKVKTYNNIENIKNVNKLINAKGSEYAILFCPTQKIENLLMPRAIVSKLEEFPIRIDNFSDVDVTIDVGKHIGLIEISKMNIEQKKIVNTSSMKETSVKSNKQPEKGKLSSLKKMHMNRTDDVQDKDCSVRTVNVTTEKGTEKDVFENSIEMKDDVENMLKNAIKHLSEEKEKQTYMLLEKYKHVFLKRDEVPTTTTNLMEHKIKTTGPPIHQHPYRRSPIETQNIEEHVQEYLENGLIEPAPTSPWSSPVLLVSKKSDSNNEKKKQRFCNDYRKINAVTERDVYPMHRVQETLDSLSEAMYFTSFDLAAGFWQIPVAEEDRDKTTFAVRSGLYRWLVMPFGLINAPATFQRLMNAVLAGLSWECALAYIDDIIIYSKTFDQHLVDLEKVLERLEKANLKIRTEKCSFVKQEIKYLSHIVGNGEIKPDSKNTVAVDSFQVTDIDSVRSFLGLAGFFRQFVKNFAMIAQPLYKLLKKDAVYVWTDDCEKAVKAIKFALTHEPVLKGPQMKKPFILHTDASAGGIGATLVQADEKGVEHPVAYVSRTLNKAERNYSTTEREALAIIYALKQFRCYVHGSLNTVVLTDHHSLRFLQTSNNLAGRLARWATQLQEYDLKIEYKPGSMNGDADALSRSNTNSVTLAVLTRNQRNTEKEKESKNETKIKRNTKIDKTSMKKSVLKKIEENKDEKEDEKEVVSNVEKILVDENDKNEKIVNINKTIVIVEKEKQSSIDTQQEEIKQKENEQSDSNVNVIDLFTQIKITQKTDSEVIKIINELNENEYENREKKIETYIIENDILYKRVLRENGWKQLIFVPASLRNDVIHLCHDHEFSAHNGITRTEERLANRFYFPGYSRSIVSYVKTCQFCSERKSGKHLKLPLFGMPTCTRPMQLIGIDIVGPYNKTTNGNEYMLTVIDYFTKYAWAIPIPDTSTEMIMKKIMKNIVCVHGAPESIITDRGSNFRSELAEAIYALINAKKIQTTSYHPQTNGLVERFHRAMNDMLSILCKQNETDWDENIQYVLMSYRSAKQKTTGYSPNYLMFGREIKTPIDISIDNEINQDETFSDIQRYVNVITERMKKATEIVEQIQNGIVEKRKGETEKLIPRFRKGDLVMLLIMQHKRGMKKKLEPRYDGPYEVIEELGTVVRRIKKLGTAKKCTVNVKKLKSYERRYEKNNKISTSHNEQKQQNESEFVSKSDEEQQMILDEKRDQINEKIIEKGEKRMREMNEEMKKKSEPTWKASVPVKIAWNENKNELFSKNELIEILKKFYNNDYRDAKRDVEQIDKQLVINIMKEKTGKEKVYEIIADEILKKLQ